MMPAVDDDVTPGEIVRTLRGLQEEIRALRGEHVRRDLYEAHRAAVAADLARLETKVQQTEQDKKTRSWQVTMALIAGGLNFVFALVLLIVKS